MAGVIAFPDTSTPYIVAANANSSTWSSVGFIANATPPVLHITQTIEIDGLMRRFGQITLGHQRMVNNSRAGIVVLLEAGTPGNTTPSGVQPTLQVPDIVGTHHPFNPLLMTG